MSDEEETPHPVDPKYQRVTFISEDDEEVNVIKFEKATVPTLTTKYEDYHGWVITGEEPSNVSAVLVEFRPLRNEVTGNYFEVTNVNKHVNNQDLRVDPTRVVDFGIASGIFVRAIDGEGHWNSYDIATLDKESFVRFLEREQTMLPWIRSCLFGLFDYPADEVGEKR